MYTVLESVAPSGMSRQLRVITMEQDGPRYLTYHVARVLGLPLKRGQLGNDVLVIRGCGMDMGFDVVDSLQRAMAPVTGLVHRWL